MGKCKTKTIQTDKDILTHIPEYSGVFKHLISVNPAFSCSVATSHVGGTPLI